jgi:hypothetical protein
MRIGRADAAADCVQKPGLTRTTSCPLIAECNI